MGLHGDLWYLVLQSASDCLDLLEHLAFIPWPAKAVWLGLVTLG